MKEEIDRAVARRKILNGLEALNRVGMPLTFRNVLERRAWLLGEFVVTLDFYDGRFFLTLTSS